MSAVFAKCVLYFYLLFIFEWGNIFFCLFVFKILRCIILLYWHISFCLSFILFHLKYIFRMFSVLAQVVVVQPCPQTLAYNAVVNNTHAQHKSKMRCHHCLRWSFCRMSSFRCGSQWEWRHVFCHGLIVMMFIAVTLVVLHSALCSSFGTALYCISLFFLSALWIYWVSVCWVNIFFEEKNKNISGR